MTYEDILEAIRHLPAIKAEVDAGRWSPHKATITVTANGTRGNKKTLRNMTKIDLVQPEDWFPDGESSLEKLLVYANHDFMNIYTSSSPRPGLKPYSIHENKKGDLKISMGGLPGLQKMSSRNGAGKTTGRVIKTIGLAYYPIPLVAQPKSVVEINGLIVPEKKYFTITGGFLEVEEVRP